MTDVHREIRMIWNTGSLTSRFRGPKTAPKPFSGPSDSHNDLISKQLLWSDPENGLGKNSCCGPTPRMVWRGHLSRAATLAKGAAPAPEDGQRDQTWEATQRDLPDLLRSRPID